MGSDLPYAGKSFDGQVVAGEFVGLNDVNERAPGTYVTILLDDAKAGLVGGRARVTYLPAPPTSNPTGAE